MRGPLRAVVFDTDGVLLDTAGLHAAAWKAALDDCRGAWTAAGDSPAPFDAERDYRDLVNGRARFDGALAFLTDREIALPAGDQGDPPGCGTVWAVAAGKERVFTEALRTRTVEAFPDVRPALNALRARGIRCAAASASRHARPLLESAGLAALFDALVDGTDADRLALAGKPAPALFLEAARRLGADPADAAVVEDALAGVEAAHRGRFGLVIGLDRTGEAGTAAAMSARGADTVARGLDAVARAVCGGQP